ncbi:MAG: tetratricopeptide repeat protein [Planctomycetota bacterium]|nr:MAG: tetratricopeptide repeat protein [Planctomycetota bacterium]
MRILIRIILMVVVFAAPAAAAEEVENASSLFQRAQYLEKVVGDLDCASRLYDLAAADPVYTASALYRKARCRLLEGDVRGALGALDKAVASPNISKSLKKKAEAARRRIQESEARLQARVRVLDVQRTLNELADDIERLKKEEAAVVGGATNRYDRPADSGMSKREFIARAVTARISELVQSESDRPGLLCYLADREFGEGYVPFTRFKYPEAISFFRAALAYDPDHKDAAKFLRLALYITGETTGKGPEFQTEDEKPKLASSRRKELLRLAGRGRDHLAAEEYGQALDFFEKALDLLQWGRDSFGNEADTVKEVKEIREKLRLTYRWLNPTKTSRLGAMRLERDLLIFNLQAQAVKLINAALTLEKSSAGEPSGRPGEGEEPRKVSTATVTPGSESSETGRKKVRLRLRLILHRPGFFEDTGVGFEPVDAKGNNLAKPAAAAWIDRTILENLRIAGRKDGKAVVGNPLESEAVASGSITLKSGSTVPYLASYERISGGGGPAKAAPVVRQTFEGVVVKASHTQPDKSKRIVMKVVISVHDIAGAPVRLPTENGIVELPRVSQERLEIQLEAGTGKIYCITQFVNPAATGRSTLTSAGGRTALTVCLEAEVVR